MFQDFQIERLSVLPARISSRIHARWKNSRLILYTYESQALGWVTDYDADPSTSEIAVQSTCSFQFFFCSPALSVHKHRYQPSPPPVG